MKQKFGTIRVFKSDDAKVVTNSIVLDGNNKVGTVLFYDEDTGIIKLKDKTEIDIKEVTPAKYFVIGDDNYNYGEIAYENYSLPFVKEGQRVLGTVKYTTNRVFPGDNVRISCLHSKLLESNNIKSITGDVPAGIVKRIVNGVIYVQVDEYVFPVNRNSVLLTDRENSRLVFEITKKLD